MWLLSKDQKISVTNRMSKLENATKKAIWALITPSVTAMPCHLIVI